MFIFSFRGYVYSNQLCKSGLFIETFVKIIPSSNCLSVRLDRKIKLDRKFIEQKNEISILVQIFRNLNS